MVGLEVSRNQREQPQIASLPVQILLNKNLKPEEAQFAVRQYNLHRSRMLPLSKKLRQKV
jgi:hypothetical protein